MSINSTTLLDQLNEALDSPKTALVFIETFLGLMTEKRQMFLNLLVPKLQFDDLDLVLQKANQRIDGKANLFVQKIESTEIDDIIPVKEEDEKVEMDEDFTNDCDIEIATKDNDPEDMCLLNEKVKSKKEKLQCDQCNYGCTNKSTLQKHIDTALFTYSNIQTNIFVNIVDLKPMKKGV